MFPALRSCLRSISWFCHNVNDKDTGKHNSSLNWPCAVEYKVTQQFVDLTRNLSVLKWDRNSLIVIILLLSTRYITYACLFISDVVNVITSLRAYTVHRSIACAHTKWGQPYHIMWASCVKTKVNNLYMLSVIVAKHTVIICVSCYS